MWTDRSELDHTENSKEKQKFHKKHLVCIWLDFMQVQMYKQNSNTG